MLMLRNSEYYADPTAGEAIAKITHEERIKELAQTKQNRYRPKVFICSPYAGDVDANTAKARAYCAFAVEQGCIPFAPHIFFPQFMKDDDPEQRELGLFMGKVFLDCCKECWVFGNKVSTGMEAEIHRARQRDIKIRYFTECCQEVFK